MSDRDDARALQFIRAFGRTGTTFQALGRALRHWFDGARGVVAYFDTGSAWVAAGEPIAARDDSIPVAETFIDAARAHGRRVCFFATEGILASSPRFRRIQIGEQPVWDPARWSDDVGAHRSLREQLRRARAKSVTVRRLESQEYSGSARTPLDRLIARWHASRSMAAMHFLVDVAPFDNADDRQLWIAERHGTVVALLSIAPVPARGGWLFEHLLRDPHAPNGTAELLVDATMRALDRDGVRWVTLGLAPLSGAVNGWLRLVRRVSRALFNFVGLAAFKRKLRPHGWEPIYLAFPREQHGVVAMFDALRAFAGGSLWRFGVASVVRGPLLLLQALSWLLVPWTLAMALAPSAGWFPHPAVHIAWVLFDLVLLGALVALRRMRGHARVADQWYMARAIAIAVTFDAALTLTEALLWNAPRTHTIRDVLMLVIACIGPWLAAVVLWGAARRLQVLVGDKP